ncbi:MAG TPA: fused gamma-glutamyl-gamma-aminobutyrate hydrolase/peptidase [Prevotellaceae bacterium]|nr:fused gamma-glutamyl-gamma-aminobutyrate hydrolase/peptidase [Prevotellaceae bacterium]
MMQEGFNKRPVIGITGNFGDKGCELAHAYYQAVLRAGGVPLVIPPYEASPDEGEDHTPVFADPVQDALARTLDSVDALLLSGGGDINPLILGEEPLPGLHEVCPVRDAQEMWLVRHSYHRQIPMLGICRGMQVISAALGGKNCQDIYSQMKGVTLLKHSQDMRRDAASHTVRVESGSLLHSIVGNGTLAVNSFHHQAVSDPGGLLRAVAHSSDGVIEAIESTEFKPILGVQWHPEAFFSHAGATPMHALFDWLVREASLFREAKEVHAHVITLDSHEDTPMFFPDSQDEVNHMFTTRTNRVLVDLPKMTDGCLDAGIMVAYIPQGERTDEGNSRALALAERKLEQIEALTQACPRFLGLARTPDDIARLKERGMKAIMRGIENGYAIGHDLSLLARFRRMGVVYMTLCHNGDNDICDSARGQAEHGGLSEFGRSVVTRMNELGMMVDLSHAAESSFYDALEVSRVPIVCSHSNSKALCPHPRNLTDDQMRALARHGGVAQVTLYHGFLRQEGEATIMDVLEHLRHMVDVMGPEHVGIGTDFDGDGGVRGLRDASELMGFTRELLRRCYSRQDLQGIWGGNFLRVMRLAQGAATMR